MAVEAPSPCFRPAANTGERAVRRPHNAAIPARRPCVANVTPSPLESLWKPTALMALVLAGEALALILALIPDHTNGRLVAFGLASLGIQWITLGTLALLYAFRRPLSRLSSAALAWTCLVLLLAVTWLIASTAWELFGDGSGAPSNGTAFVLRMCTIALVVGLLTLIAFQNYAQAKYLAVRTKQLELESLRARIRPHFLFNTLNTGAALVHARPDEAERVLLDLADLFRAALRGPERIPLEKEIELTRRYLEIESLRFGPRLQVSWSLPERLPDTVLPALSLQPLAENAIRHGIERLPGGGRIDIRLECEAGWIRIDVVNDMPGDGSRAADGHRIGLNSARERISALSEGRGGIETRMDDGRHVVTLRIPDTSDPKGTA
ncbi:MAG: sensor histidine kinase [Thermomonas sp.]